MQISFIVIQHMTEVLLLNKQVDLSPKQSRKLMSLICLAVVFFVT